MHSGKARTGGAPARTRRIRALFAAAVIAATITGCASSDNGGGDTGFDFNGYWEQDWTLVRGTQQYTVGSKGKNWATITQNGTSLTLVFPGRSALSGSCDPTAGTFSVTGADPPKSYRLEGRAVDSSTLAGEEVFVSGDATFTLDWTMRLVRR